MTLTSDHPSDNSDGTERLDIELARTKVAKLANSLQSLAHQALELKEEIGKLLDELDSRLVPDVTEPHVQVPHE